MAPDGGGVVGARDRQPERAAHRSPERFPSERIGSADGDDAGGSPRLDGANHRPGVAGILYAAQSDDERPRDLHGVHHPGGVVGGQGHETARRRGRAQRVHDRRGHPNHAGDRLEPARQPRDPVAGGRGADRREVHAHARCQGVLHQSGTFQEYRRAAPRVVTRGAPEPGHEGVAPAGDRFH